MSLFDHASVEVVRGLVAFIHDAAETLKAEMSPEELVHRAAGRKRDLLLSSGVGAGEGVAVVGRRPDPHGWVSSACAGRIHRVISTGGTLNCPRGPSL